MSEAVKRVETILKSEFEMNNYVGLIREIFSTVRIVEPERFRAERSNFSSHVEGSYHVGNYETPDEKKIAVFTVQLKQRSYVENSRSTQRSYAKKLIENGNCDAALIAYYTPNDKEKKWRLSFVRLDYDMKIENGRLKTEENLTPARRYSFLVGEGEPCHTAVERFRLFIMDNNSQPTMDELEEAFSVEAVTKEFFELYCEKFYQLVEYLDTNEDFISESQRCGFTTEQFAKKLMGQIVFLYFLQKKGWLGVGVWVPTLAEKEYNNIFYIGGARGRIIKEYLPQLYIKQDDGSYKLRVAALDVIPDDAEELIANSMPGNRNWGSGSRTFLRTLFDFSQKHKGHFYEEYLEPLFYDTLNKNRGVLGYSTILHCRIPFLSGGLFEPLDGYDWKSCYFDIPDEIFSNKKDETDLKADGILDIFDRYNFTMSEDEPMEREVAIDPEMLGKVFENLLDVKDRKSKGAFYTPREIVHYMCQESLVNYLTTNVDISEEAIRDFILYGDFYKDSDTEKTKRVTGEDGKTHYVFDEERTLKISPEIFSFKDGVNRIHELDELLKNIRVADPAVGSGAFPLGMLNEIVRARQNLSAYMAISMNDYNKKMMYTNERSVYTLKYETIRNCIFAADIEPSAVDIAQLRLWLALVIDDEINPDAQSPLDGHRNPLPLPNLECNIVCGNSLMDEFEGQRLIPQSTVLGTNYGEQYGMYQMELEALIPKLIELQDRLFRCDDPMKKIELKAEVEALKDQMIHTELSAFAPDTLVRYDESKHQNSKPYVLWQIEFARVFKEKGGFDVVIGNPPYVDSEEMTRSMPVEREIYTRKYDCAKGNWDLFVLFVEKGMNLLKKDGIISYIVPNKIVAAPYTSALRTKLSENQMIEMRDYSNVTVFKTAAVYPVVFRMKMNQEKNPVIMDVMENMEDISNHNVISADKFYKDINWDKYFNSSQSALEIIEKMGKFKPLKLIAEVNGAATVNEAYLVKEYLYDEDSSDNDSVKKFINTGGLDPYKSFWGSEYIRYLKGKYMYPVATKSDIESMSEKRLKESNSSKIIIGGMTKILECYYDEGEYLAGKSTTIVYGYDHLKYITAVLNSKLMTFYYSTFYNSMSLAGGFFRVGAPQIKELPIAMPSDNKILEDIEEYVDRLQSLLKSEPNEEVDELKGKIDSLIYEIYGLSLEEIKVVEGEA
jgi:adenine-specific DNA-methyltransferase